MRLLTIDTATRIGTIATFCDGQLLCEFRSPTPVAQAERLLGLVRDILSETGWTLSDLDLLAVGVGPGSFTGVRVGMATAKGIAFPLHLPLIGVVSLQTMAHGARTVAGNVPAVCLLDAKKGEVFAAVYDHEGQDVVPPTHLPRDTVAPWLQSLDPALLVGAVLCGEVVCELNLNPSHLVSLSNPACDLPTGRSLAALAEDRWKVAPISQLLTLEPLYVRSADVHLPQSRQ